MRHQLTCIWIDNRTSYSDKWLSKDSFFGNKNYRIELGSSCNGQIGVSEFYCGMRRRWLTDITGLIGVIFGSRVKGEHFIIRGMSEWTLSEGFLEQQSRIIEEARRFSSSTVVWLHVCDTHHGIKPIRHAMKVQEHVRADVISCNQAHHLHFFDAQRVAINMPRVSIDSVGVYREIQDRRLTGMGAGERIYFPYKKNGVHIKREIYGQALSSQLGPCMSSERYEDYGEWLDMIKNSKCLVYVGLGATLGLNNLIPTRYTKTPIVSSDISHYTGCEIICKVLGLELVRASGIEEMYKTICSLERSESFKEGDFRQMLKKMPTPKEYLHAWIMGNENNLSQELRPERLDSRYVELRKARGRLADDEVSLCIAIYEDLQNLVELGGETDKWEFKISMHFSPQFRSYLSKLVKDLCGYRDRVGTNKDNGVERVYILPKRITYEEALLIRDLEPSLICIAQLEEQESLTMLGRQYTRCTGVVKTKSFESMFFKRRQSRACAFSEKSSYMVFSEI